MIGFGRALFIAIFAAGVVGPVFAGAGKIDLARDASSAFGHSASSVFDAALGARDDATAPDAKPEPPPVQTRQQQLDDLFIRLAASRDEAETNGLVAAIDRLQLESGSDTADFLMARAIAALGAHNLPVSRSLLDKIVILRPDWAEAWNKRATVRYLAGDSQGSMADIAETLKREPRHLGALAGLGAILEEAGRREEALQVYQRGLDIAPQYRPMKDAAERLKAALAGQTL
jgi:tetratricopeptide (TPR) repeat protein